MNNKKIKPGNIYLHKVTNSRCVVIKVLNALEVLVRTKENSLEIYKLFELIKNNDSGSKVLEGGFRENNN